MDDELGIGRKSGEPADDTRVSQDDQEILQTDMPHHSTAYLHYQAYQQQQVAAAFAASQQNQVMTSWQQQQIATYQQQMVMSIAATQQATEPRTYCHCGADWCRGGNFCIRGIWRKRKKVGQKR